MKRTFFLFALPLLLALSPTAASAARILWVSVDDSALVVDKATDAELGTVGTYTFLPSGQFLNAARVSIEGADGSPSSTYLLFVYDAGNGPVYNDPDAHTTELPSSSGSGSSPGEGSGPGESGSGLTSRLLALYIDDSYGDYDDEDLNVELELGYVNWTAVDNGTATLTPSTGFTRLAFATATLAQIADEGNVTPLGTTNPPGQTGWSPGSYTAVPEPSVCCLALLGVVLLSKRRKVRTPAG